MSANSLRPSDLEMFAAIGVDGHILQNAGVRRVSHQEARDLCGIRYKSDHLEGVAFPYRDPDGHDQPIVAWRVRRDHPEVDSDSKPIAKYVSSPDRRHLYFGSAAHLQLADASKPVIIVEAEKSVIAIATARLKANRAPWALLIATGGCWGWRGVVGKATSSNGARVDEKGPVPDLDRVTWTGRDVIIIFDANVATNEKVQAARRALGAELTKRGAKVRIAELPVEPGINGPDDYIGKHGAEAFWTLVDEARSAMVPKKAVRPEKKPQGRELQFADPEPWPDAVDGAALLAAIATMFETYVALPRHAAVALALWVVHAYAFDAFFITPFLAITSPVKRCGKTLLLILVGALVPRSLFTSNVSPAVLFRVIEKYGPTLLIDEADTFVRDNDELRGVLNSGHTRKTAVVTRAVGDDHEPRVFSTWCPKAIALIGNLPGTLEDRAITIRMRRRTDGEAVQRLRQDRIDALCADLRRQAARWAQDHFAELQGIDPDMPDALHDRAADCWRSLIAIADVMGGTWPERAREAALALSSHVANDDAGVLLLRDIQAIFADEGSPDVLASSTLIERLVSLEDRPWSEWSKGQPLSAAKLARILAAYDIHPAGSIRIGTKVAKGYRLAAFSDAWERYTAAPEGLQRNKPNKDGPESALSRRYSQSECNGFGSVTNPMNTEPCNAVTALGPGEGEEAWLDV